MPGTTGDIAQTIRDFTGHTGVTVTDALVLEAIAFAIGEMELAADWQGQDTAWTFTYGPADNGIPVPLSVVFLEAVYQVNPNEQDPSRRFVPLQDLTRFVFFDRSAASDQSRTFPRPPLAQTAFWYVWAQTLYLVPQPTADLSIVVDTRQLQPRLTAVSTTPDATTSNYYTQKYQIIVEALALAHVWHALGEDEYSGTWEQRSQRFMGRGTKNEAIYKAGGGPKVRGT